MFLPKIDLFMLSVMSLPGILNGWENQYYSYWENIDISNWDEWSTRSGISSDGNLDLYQDSLTGWGSQATNWEEWR